MVTETRFKVGSIVNIVGTSVQARVTGLFHDGMNRVTADVFIPSTYGVQTYSLNDLRLVGLNYDFMNSPHD